MTRTTLNYIIVTFFFICAGIINSQLNRPRIVVDKQSSAFNISSQFTKMFSMGQSRLLADLVWISTLLESDTDHYQKLDLNSWMYLRFKTIATLDPKFLRNYQFGGKYLSIVKDDLQGAKELFNMGLKYYQEDYDLLYNSAFLYAFELDDTKEAYQRYLKIMNYPQTPAFVRTLIPKLKFESTGDLQVAYKYLKSILEKEQDPLVMKKIKQDLYAIKAQLDLECLNSHKSNCERKDFEGNSYIKKGAIYKAPKEYKKYRLFRKS